MPLAKNITHIMWDWDGPILQHSTCDVSFYWETLGRVVKKLDLCGGCEIKRGEIVNGFSADRKKYETLFDYLHHEHGACFQTVMKMHHEILLAEFRDRYELKEPAYQGLLSLQGSYRHIVNTHAHEIWIENWQKIYPQLEGLFDACFYPKQHGYGDKRHDAEAYIQPLAELGVNPKNVVMVEDSSVNLAVPHALGMVTVFLNLKQQSDIPNYVDHVFDSTAEFCAFAQR